MKSCSQKSCVIEFQIYHLHPCQNQANQIFLNFTKEDASPIFLQKFSLPYLFLLSLLITVAICIHWPFRMTLKTASTLLLKLETWCCQVQDIPDGVMNQYNAEECLGRCQTLVYFSHKYQIILISTFLQLERVVENTKFLFCLFVFNPGGSRYLLFQV